MPYDLELVVEREVCLERQQAHVPAVRVIQKSVSLKREPASKPLHISVKGVHRDKVADAGWLSHRRESFFIDNLLV